MTKSSGNRKNRRSQRRTHLRAIKGGKRPQVTSPDGVPDETLEKTPDGRFAMALGKFVHSYMKQKQQHPEPIDQLAASGVLLRLAAGLAVPAVGEDGEQFYDAAATVYEQEYHKLEGPPPKGA